MNTNHGNHHDKEGDNNSSLSDGQEQFYDTIEDDNNTEHTKSSTRESTSISIDRRDVSTPPSKQLPLEKFATREENPTTIEEEEKSPPGDTLMSDPLPPSIKIAGLASESSVNLYSLTPSPPLSSLSSSLLSVHQFAGQADPSGTTTIPSPRLSHYRPPGPSTATHPLAELPRRNPSTISTSSATSATFSTSSIISRTSSISIDRGDRSSITKEKHLPIPVRVKSKKKTRMEFNNMLLIQTLVNKSDIEDNPSLQSSRSSQHSSPLSQSSPLPQSPSSQSVSLSTSSNSAVYAMEFSHDGNFLAVGGEDGRVRIWKTIDTEEDSPSEGTTSLKEIFAPIPLQVLQGHGGAVLDLAWSKNSFLLSASLDRTVRLWHPSRADCLGVFHHPDFVTSVAFHPRDDRLFISGSLDCRLRLWSIAERAVRAWNELPTSNFITAVGFNRSGRLALAGTSTGVCLVFETEGFSYSTQIHVRSRRGKNRLGHKVCGIEAMPGNSGEEKILISTNDSRIRLYTLRDKSLISKFIGHLNTHSQIAATLSDDGEYVLSGSEDGRVYFWSTEGRYSKTGFFSRSTSIGRHVKACEWISSIPRITTTNRAANSGVVTTNVVRAAPSVIRHRLQAIGRRPVVGGGESSMAEGMIIVVGNQNGTICVYENNPSLLEWLQSSSTSASLARI